MTAYNWTEIGDLEWPWTA